MGSVQVLRPDSAAQCSLLEGLASRLREGVTMGVKPDMALLPWGDFNISEDEGYSVGIGPALNELVAWWLNRDALPDALPWVPRNQLLGVGRALTYGSRSHGRGELVQRPYSQPFNSAVRHALKALEQPLPALDPEHGIPHVHLFWAQVTILHALVSRKKGQDDRPQQGE
jgi:hypothetical protein